MKLGRVTLGVHSIEGVKHSNIRLYFIYIPMLCKETVHYLYTWEKT